MSTYYNHLQPALRNLLQRVVQFFHPRSSCMTTHISADVQGITLNVSCMTISGGRTKQLDIFCRVTGFASDFLSFIDVELTRFFHGALQLLIERMCDYLYLLSIEVVDRFCYLGDYVVLM